METVIRIMGLLASAFVSIGSLIVVLKLLGVDLDASWGQAVGTIAIGVGITVVIWIPIWVGRARGNSPPPRFDEIDREFRR